jgi:hypothetical protein
MVKTLITAAFAIVAALACIGAGGEPQSNQAESVRTARG